MEMSLRKAAQLRTALTRRLAQITLQPQATVSVYEDNAADPVEQGRVELLEQLELARRLEDILFDVRAAIGRANAQSGIDDLLAEKAKLGLREARLTQLVAYPARRMDLALGKLHTMKARVASTEGSGYGLQESLLVEVLAEEDLAAIQAELVAVRRRQAEISDQLLARNVSATVAVPDDVVAFLETPNVGVL